MDGITREKLDKLYSEDAETQHRAFLYILKATDSPVDWAYEVWDEMVEALRHKSNRVRSIASQVLCNLAKSDPDNRIRNDFNALLAVTKDERFVTARHCLQALWKIGVANPEQRAMVVNGLEGRFQECRAEKNGTLIRFDIIEDLRKLYDVVKDESIKAKALEWIETEEDSKYHKKYARVWKEN